MSRIGAAYVAQLKSLRWLETAGGYLDDQGVTALRPLASSLTYLSIAQNPRVTDEAWDTLDRFHSLRQLNISGTGMSIGASVKPVVKLTALRGLSINGLSGTKTEADSLVAAMSQLNVSCSMPHVQ